MSMFFLWAVIVLFMFLCVIMTLLVLIQKGRGGGLSSAFGGSGGNTAFGAKTGDVLTWATSVVFGLFIVLAVVLNLLSNHVNSVNYPQSAAPVSQPQQHTPAPMPVPASPQSF